MKQTKTISDISEVGNIVIKANRRKTKTSKLIIGFIKKFWCCYIPTILILFMITLSVLLTQKQMFIESEKYCNDHYGYDNWYWKETTGTEDCKNYIGQCWKCFPKSHLPLDTKQEGGTAFLPTLKGLGILATLL